MPNLPGVYRMINSKMEVIYIGKAKNLRKRVASYFVKKQSSPRTRLMIGNINSIEFTITNTEADALILENNLIKKILPRYNVIFRDDKSYPYLMITGDKFPRLMFHRGSQKKENQYFGPFPNSNAVRQSIQLLQKVFMLRTCEDSVFNNRTRPCLQHQIKRCTAPCVDLIDKFSYQNDIKQAALFLQGKESAVIDDLTNRMNESSEEFEYERAAMFRDRIQSLRQVRLKQSVSDFSENDADIIAVAEDLGQVCVNLVMIRGGRHLGDKSFFPKNSVEQNIENIIEVFLTQYYDQKTPPPVLVVEKNFDKNLINNFFQLKNYPKIKIISKIMGDKKLWLAMASKNAQIALKQKQNEHSSKVNRVKAFRKLLNLPEQINRIECGMLSYGSDMTLEENPYDISLGKFVHLEKNADFLSKEALTKIKLNGITRELVGVEINQKTSDEFIRDHLPIYDDSNIVGKITSSVYSPRLKKNIGLAIINNNSKESENLHLLYDDRKIEVRISKLPFIRNK